MSPRLVPPPAASQPFANEGTAAGCWETDGPPHLNGFDPAARASTSSGPAGAEIRLGQAKAQIPSPRGLQRAARSESPLAEVSLKSEGAGSLCGGRGPFPAGGPAGPRKARQATGITFLP